MNSKKKLACLLQNWQVKITRETITTPNTYKKIIFKNKFFTKIFYNIMQTCACADLKEKSYLSSGNWLAKHPAKPKFSEVYIECLLQIKIEIWATLY